MVGNVVMEEDLSAPDGVNLIASYRHPHTGATYRVLNTEAGIGVEVLIPDREAVTLIGFNTRADAERWIDRYKVASARSPNRQSALGEQGRVA